MKVIEQAHDALEAEIQGLVSLHANGWGEYDLNAALRCLKLASENMGKGDWGNAGHLIRRAERLRDQAMRSWGD